MKNICVYAGSNLGIRSQYKEHARLLGEEIVKQDLQLIYGGSRIGLMGELANTVLDLGGTVIGIMPKGLFIGEMVHPHISQLIEVNDMHERKATMNEMADGFVALPGGYGTLEELFESLCWAQIGIHKKPIGLYNIEGYYNPLLAMTKHAVTEEFMNPNHLDLMVSADNAAELLQQMKQYTPPVLGNKWKQIPDSI
ncbi:TIGR00730 family Rossman fold protein [Ectobacillus sp. sgz5001026]|uniref:LOG family protein n=1 Tax=Ectobacillus sp. sgz5001026 TaxID=3242473 RepID=UPI0036D21615